jgi:hypothetical protein
MPRGAVGGWVHRGAVTEEASRRIAGRPCGRRLGPETGRDYCVSWQWLGRETGHNRGYDS